MFVEFLSHVLALDIGWIIQLVLNNLFFLFAFIAIMHYFMDGKRVLVGFAALTASVWLWSDFSNFIGAVVFTGGFLILHYMGKMAVLAFAENSVAMKKKLIIFNEIQGIATWIIYNIMIGTFGVLA